MWRDARARGVALDVASVTGITLVTAAVSQRWASLLLDAMFYASESVFGSAVTDRAVETSYYWTRLGYIVPVRALTTALGTWAGFEAFRILLIAGLAAGLFAVARTFTRRLPAIAIVTPLTMSSVVLTFVGTSYLTGAVLAGTAVVIALGLRRGLWPHVAAGAVLGWLAMVNPPGLLLAATCWVAVRIHGRIDVRRTALAVASAAAVFVAFLGLGRVVFPALDWFDTYLTWNAKLNYADFASHDPVWLHDISLLVPLIALVLAVGAWINDRTQRSSQLAVIVSLSSIGFMLAFSPLMGGIALEAPMYQAMLWPPALVSICLVVAGRTADRAFRPVPVIVAGTAATALVVVSGHFTGIVPGGWGVVLAVAACAVGIVSVWVMRRLGGTAAVVTAVVALALVLSSAQVLQNSRRTIGLYPTTPYSYAFVPNPSSEKMHVAVNAQQWLLDHTTDADSILNWVGGDWVGGDRELYMVAAMQLWGENRVTLEPTLTADDTARLESLRPSVIQMVAPTTDQILAFWRSLPTSTHPTAPECYDFSWPMPDLTTGHSCLTRLTWPAA